MTTIKSIKIAILCFVHFKGWCGKMHNDPKLIDQDDWRTGCPLVDRIVLDLYPPVIWAGSKEAFDEAIQKNRFRPGEIFTTAKD